MKSLTNKIGLGKLLGLAFVSAILFYAVVVYANPFQFSSSASSEVATSTLRFMTPAMPGSRGAATTTVYYDAFEVDGTNQTNNGNTLIPDSAIMLVQYTSTTTPSTLTWRYEYSDGSNCKTNPEGCDWYADNFTNTYTASTTIATANVAQSTSFDWAFASSTNICNQSQILSSNSRGCKLVSVPTPTRFTKAVFYLSGAGNGAFHAKIIPKKQVRQ